MASMPLITPITEPRTIRSLLFATDFSPPSERAMRYALAIAARGKSKLFLVHVLFAKAAHSLTDLGVSEFDPRRRETETQLRVLQNSGRLTGVDHSIIVERGGVWRVLAKLIEKNRIDLVVLGTRGRSGIPKLILGSVAEEVLRLAACPVLTIAPHVPEFKSGQTFRNILLATDYLAGSLNAVPYGFCFAQLFHAKVTFLHAIDATIVAGAVSREELQAQERERLKTLVPGDVAAEVEFQAEFGPATDVILAVAASKRADLIVMGAHATRAPAASTHLPWTVAHRVVCHAPCPVLTVREPRGSPNLSGT